MSGLGPQSRLEVQQILAATREWLHRPDPSTVSAIVVADALRRVQEWVAALPDSVDATPTAPTCRACGQRLEGRQTEWCSEACRSRIRRRDRVATAQDMI